MGETYCITLLNMVCFTHLQIELRYNIYYCFSFLGDENILNVLIQNGALNLKTTDSENLTPIHLAALNRNKKYNTVTE